MVNWLDTHYSASQFTWDNISEAMVPSGYWSKEKIKLTAKTWNSKPIEEVHVTEILPAKYNPSNINIIVKKTNSPV
jgi:hypothetical protein